MPLLNGTRMASSFLQEQAFPPLLMWAHSSPSPQQRQPTVECTSVLCPMCMAMMLGPLACKFKITVKVYWTSSTCVCYVRMRVCIYVDVAEYFSQSMDAVKLVYFVHTQTHSEWGLCLHLCTPHYVHICRAGACTISTWRNSFPGGWQPNTDCHCPVWHKATMTWFVNGQ